MVWMNSGLKPLSHAHRPSVSDGPAGLLAVCCGLLFLHWSGGLGWRRGKLLAVLQIVTECLRLTAALTRQAEGHTETWRGYSPTPWCPFFVFSGCSHIFPPHTVTTLVRRVSQTFCLFSCCRQQCWCHWSCRSFSVSTPHSPCCPSVVSNHKQETVGQTLKPTGLERLSPPEGTEDEHMCLTSKCTQSICHSPTASPAAPACVPSRPVSGRWCPGARRWKRGPHGWARAGLRSGESEAWQFAPVSSAPVVVGQWLAELSATLKSWYNKTLFPTTHILHHV